MRRAILPIAAVLLTAACGGTTIINENAPRATTSAAATAPVPVSPSPTVSASPPPSPTPTPSPAAPPPATRPALTSASAVVEQYYQDITDHDYADAWSLGGSNIAGESYDQYVAGFATTANINLGTVSDFGSSEVRAVLYATQTDGTVKVFEGTYTVVGGLLVGASITQTG